MTSIFLYHYSFSFLIYAVLDAEFRAQEEQRKKRISESITNRYIFNGVFVLLAMCLFPMISFYSANYTSGENLDADVVKLRAIKARLEAQKSKANAEETENTKA